MRRSALLLAALILLVSAVRRLRTRTRAAVILPSWFGPWTAGPLGVLATGADLPNAFPYLVAIERLNAAGVATGVGVTVLALYAFVYCLPCLILLIAGLGWRGRITEPLQGCRKNVSTTLHTIDVAVVSRPASQRSLCGRCSKRRTWNRSLPMVHT